MQNPFDIPPYIKKFGLNEAPYTTNADERFLYLNGGSHLDAINMCAKIIQNKEGGGLIIGEQGTGKTSTLRRVATLLSSTEGYKVGVILTAGHTPRPFQFVKAVLEAFGQDCIGRDITSRIQQLNKYLLNQKNNNITTILLIDEAQQIKKPIFEELRGFLNMEHPKMGKLMQIILFGMPEIDRPIRRSSLRTRLYRTVLSRLSETETRDMLKWRFTQAGGIDFPFDNIAINEIFNRSEGNPRTICALAQLALEFSGNNNEPVTREVIDFVSKKRIL